MTKYITKEQSVTLARSVAMNHWVTSEITNLCNAAIKSYINSQENIPKTDLENRIDGALDRLLPKNNADQLPPIPEPDRLTAGAAVSWHSDQPIQLMSDKELLDLAAIAAGIVLTWDIEDRFGEPWTVVNGVVCANWNPLEDDGDALRLAVKLGIDIAKAQLDYWDKHSNDPYAATRRTIVHAAAEIGRLM